MQHVPTSVWNQIAATQSLATPWAQQTFALDQDRLVTVLEAVETALGGLPDVPAAVIVPYSTALPSLMEHRAISAWIAETDSPAMAETLHPDWDRRTWVAMLTREHRLDSSTAIRLWEMLPERKAEGPTPMTPVLRRLESIWAQALERHAPPAPAAT